MFKKQDKLKKIDIASEKLIYAHFFRTNHETTI